MTQEQQQWIMAMKASNSKPSRGAREPQWGPRRFVYRLVQSQPFEFVVMGVVGLNVLGMALEYHHIEENEVLYMIYVPAMALFSYVYYSEALLKMFGLGPTNYIMDPWHRFDFFLVCMSVLDQFFRAL